MSVPERVVEIDVGEARLVGTSVHLRGDDEVLITVVVQVGSLNHRMAQQIVRLEGFDDEVYATLVNSGIVQDDVVACFSLMPCTYNVQASVVVNVDDVRTAGPFYVKRAAAAVGRGENQGGLCEVAVATAQENALPRVVVGIRLNAGVGSGLLESHDVHVPVVVEVAGDDGGHVGHPEQRLLGRRRPTVTVGTEE